MQHTLEAHEGPIFSLKWNDKVIFGTRSCMCLYVCVSTRAHPANRCVKEVSCRGSGQGILYYCCAVEVGLYSNSHLSLEDPYGRIYGPQNGMPRRCAIDIKVYCLPRVFRGCLSFQGNYLLSGSSDKSAIVWDVARGDVQQQFRFHEAPTLVSINIPSERIFVVVVSSSCKTLCQLDARFILSVSEVEADIHGSASRFAVRCPYPRSPAES